MPVKYLAITIAGAVSLGSYEAGATYEILDAIRQHNDDPETAANGDFIRIDVLTGASAGGMTAAILAQKLLFAKNAFVDAAGKSAPYDNPLYNTWVKGIDIRPLLDADDKPLPDGDPATLSILSSNLIESISKNLLAQADASGQIPLDGGPHNAVDPNRGIQLGLALTNLNGVNYAYPMFDGQSSFLYTDFSDQMIRPLGVNSRALAPWQELAEAAVACGAFPVAFRTKDLSRKLSDFLPDGTLVRFPDPTTFTYTDGGVLQNQPLGMAKNLVDVNDQHLENDFRFYLFVSPSPMDGKQNLNLHEAGASILDVLKRLVDVYTGQSIFRDWIQAKEINTQIDILDKRATGLAAALAGNKIDSASLARASQQVVNLLYATEPGAESQARALQRLSLQYASEVTGLGGPASANANAFLLGILALEKSAGLGERDKMQIYGIVTKDGELAGAAISAFLGFLDQAFRDHDYDWGRTVAQNLLSNPAFNAAGQLGPIRYTPAPIRPINPALTGLRLDQVPDTDVAVFKKGLTARINEILKDRFTNPLERYPAQLGADLILKLALGWEFSRDIQE